MIQHTTAARRHSLLDNYKFKYKYYIITSTHKQKKDWYTTLFIKDRIFTHRCELTDRALQLLPCRRCSLNWFTFAFSLSFYTIFWSPSPLKPCGYCSCLKMMKHVPFSPNLCTTVWYVLNNNLRDLRMWRKGGLPFPFAGWSFWGWVYNNQYQNENGYVTHPVLTLPLLDKFYVPFLLQVVVAGDGSTKTNIKMNTKWLCNTSRSHPTSTPLHDAF
jgi:hypothetical protein